MRGMISVKSYSYSKLIIAYGNNTKASVIIQWNANDKAFKLAFRNSESLWCS